MFSSIGLLCVSCNINNNKLPKTVSTRVSKEVEHSYLKKCYNMVCAPSGSQSPVPGLHVVEAFGTNKRRGKGKNLVPLNNQCFRQVESESG